MLRRDRQMRMQIHQVVDACIVAISFWLAYGLRSDASIIEFFKLNPVGPFRGFVWLYLVLMPAAPLILEAQGFYLRPILCSRWTTLWQLFKSCIVICLVIVLALFFSKMLIARWVVIWFGLITFTLIFSKEEIMRVAWKRKLAHVEHHRRFLLMGPAEETARMREDFKRHGEGNIEVVAELDLNQATAEQLVQLLHEHSINGVILSAKRSYFDQVEAFIQICELEGVEAWLVAEFFKTRISRTSFDDFYGRPLLVFRSVPEASWESVLKPVIDFAGALVLVILSAPILVVTAILIRFTSPGPIFFRQQRSGLNGRPFTIYKFRTMVTDAEQRKHELAAMNEMSGPVFKMTCDPRITPLGKLLRKFSLDEFPQLFNVLLGEMSLVGPR